MTRDLRHILALPRDRHALVLLAAALHTGSRILDRLALRLADTRAPLHIRSLLEFHAEAGAPEGALYVDGRLVGTVTGVGRP